MKRRALLGTLASLAVAGCTGRPPSDALALGMPSGQADCPPFGDDTERVVCYPEHADAPLSLAPSTDAADLPNADLTFTLANDTDTTFMTNFYSWALWKRENGQWFHVAPQVTPDPLHTLPSGESHAWRGTMTSTGHADGGPSDDQDVSVAGLGGGEYAFTTDGWFEDSDYEHKVGLGAHFELHGEPVSLTPTDDASSTRDGDTVVVTTDAESTEHTRRAFVVERETAPSNRPVRRRITEQLLRPALSHTDASLFRNTIPFFEDGVTTVRLETQNGTTPAFGVDEPYYLEYEGETYRVSAEELE